MARFAEAAQGVVAIDGKVLRRSFDAASGKSALHMVTAWGCDQRLVLAQIATDATSHEITAVPRLLDMLSLKGTIDPETRPTDVHTTVDGDHGRIETRTCTVSTDIGWLQEVHDWPGLNAIGKVVRIRETGAKVTTETAYYLLSTPLSAERFGHVARSHWAVENSLH